MYTDSKNPLKFVTSPSSTFSSHRPTLSENRYNTLSEEPSLIQPVQEFSLKDIIPKINSHNRVLSQPFDVLTPDVLFSHKRQKSLGQKPLGQLFDTSQRNTPKMEDIENYENYSRYQSHSRKVSDCDMVVFNDCKETFSSMDAVKKSLPVFGSNPCSAYCRTCDREVHTRVEFAKKPSIPFNLLDFISSFFACCGEPAWLLKMRVHKCEYCGKVLARSTK